MQFPYWMIPLAVTTWMVVWVYVGWKSGGMLVMQMRAVGGVLLTASVWLIWWLMDGVRYFYE